MREGSDPPRVPRPGKSFASRLGWILVATVTLLVVGAVYPPAADVLMAPKVNAIQPTAIRYWIAVLVGVPADAEKLKEFCSALPKNRCMYSYNDTAEDQACRPGQGKGDRASNCEPLTFVLARDSEPTHPGRKKLTLEAEEGEQTWGVIDYEYCGYRQPFAECLDAAVQEEMAQKVIDHDRDCHAQGKKCTVTKDHRFQPVQ